MVFEQAWSIVKDVDFKIPRPTDAAPTYLDQDANLAFRGSAIPHWWNWENPHGQRDDINPVTGKEWENPHVDEFGTKWPNRDDFSASIAWEMAFRAAKEGRKIPKSIEIGRGEMGGFEIPIKDEFILPPPYMDYEVGDFGEDMHEGKDAGLLLSRHHGLENVRDEIERASLVRALMDAGIVDRKEISDALDEASYASGRGVWSSDQKQVGGPPMFPQQTYRQGPHGTEDAQDQNERYRLQEEHEKKYPEPQGRLWLTTQLGGREGE